MTKYKIYIMIFLIVLMCGFKMVDKNIMGINMMNENSISYLEEDVNNRSDITYI